MVMLTKWKMAALVLAAVFGGTAGVAYRAPAGEPTDPKAEPPKAAKDDDKSKDDADVKTIQGTWVVVSAEQGGQAAPADLIKDFTVVITADTVTFKPQGDSESDQAAYKLDPEKKPKVIELTPRDGPAKGKAIRCLYELDGDRLKLCLQNGPGEEPKEFATKPGSNMRLLVLKRQPAEQDKPADKPAPPGKGDEEGQKLVRDWCDVAKKAFDSHNGEFVTGKVPLQPAIDAAHRLLAAELERSATKADRVAAYQAHLDRITDIMKVVKVKADAGRLAASDIADAEYFRLEAEILLEREKAK